MKPALRFVGILGVAVIVAGRWATQASAADQLSPNYVLNPAINGPTLTPAWYNNVYNVAPYIPSEMRGAYGVNNVTFNNGTITGDGSGQTVAIIDPFDAPTIKTDLAAFNTQFKLPTCNFTVVNQTGGTNYPAVDSNPNIGQNWGLETSLDVEWVHAMAPKANILLVEANSASTGDFLAAVDYARNAPGVSVVSMSGGTTEDWTSLGTYTSHLVTPAGHTGVTFVASTGDTGAGVSWPAASKNVVAVGGTSLVLNATTGAWSSETAWSGSSGGTSTVQPKPGFQTLIPTPGGGRSVPDVAMAADGGVWVADSHLGGWFAGVGGTSLSAPMFAGLMAVADQGRALNGLTPLDSSTNTLQLLYGLPTGDFHDITSGNNGYAAGPGYDLVTGRGSPIANLMIADLSVPEPATLTLLAVGILSGLARRRLKTKA